MENSDNNNIDDSFITPEDKKNLLIHIKQIYINKHAWADDVLIKCLIKNHYNETVKNIDKDLYLYEKENLNTDDLINMIN